MTVANTIIVVPCYNEADRLDVDTFRTFDGDACSTRLLFVNDGSTDATADVLEKLCEKTGHWSHSLDRNSGKAEAVRQGVLRAIEAGAEYVGYWDADLATPLDAIPVVRAPLEANAELVGALGSRVQMLGRQIDRRALRHYMGRVFATLAGTILGISVYDTQCGAKVFRVGDATRAIFATPFISRWVFDVGIIARLAEHQRETNGQPVRELLIEVPLAAWRDVAGSKLKLRHMIGAFLDLLRICRRYSG